jgi:hypothetical protein
MTVYIRGVYFFVEISSILAKAVLLPKKANKNRNRTRSGEVIFTAPEKEILPQPEKEK